MRCRDREALKKKKERKKKRFYTESEKAGSWHGGLHAARVDSNIIEAVAFSNSMN